MKKRTVVIAVIFILLLSYGVLAQGDYYDLSLDLEEGWEYKLTNSITQIIEQDVMGMPMLMEHFMELEYSFVIDQISRDHNYHLGVKVTSVDFDIVRIESELLDRLEEENEGFYDEINSELDSSMESLEGMEFKLVISNKGKIIDASGYGDLLKEILDDDNAVGLDAFMDDDFIESTWSEFLAYLPQEPVKIGDSWDSTIEVGGPMDFVITSKYSLAEVSDDRVVIVTDGNFVFKDIELDEEALEGMDIDFDFNGKQNGEIILDPNNNWIREMNLIQDMSGTVIISSPFMDEEFRMPMESKSESKVTGDTYPLEEELLDMSDKKGIEAFGPAYLLARSWVNDSFNYGLGFITYNDDGFAMPINFDGVFKRYDQGRVRLSLTGGYRLTFGNDEINDSSLIAPQYWVGLGVEYIAFGKLGVRGFYGLTNTKEEDNGVWESQSEFGPKLGVTYYW
ncbi:DUF6263 family protein [Halonatronum saccharophilum]|uniref:DUF6263 family protein n=1 Tax=Halonatronum saccharophilum TaxID=150060 RepID=UPI000489E3A6|nr:DUF6263 family protein [Halonatronum saccharophilum]